MNLQTAKICTFDRRFVALFLHLNTNPNTMKNTTVESQKTMRDIYDFFKHLCRNNNKEWFTAHKQEYLECQAKFNEFAQQLIMEIGKFDPYIDPDRLTVKECTYRIYRDIRFSKDKTPYKNHIGLYITRGGKKGPYAGYYFHMQPPAVKDYFEGSMLYVGLYMPEPKVITSIRDEISVNGGELIKAIKEAKHFTLFDGDTYKKLPRGFEDVKNPEWQKLLKLKEISLGYQMTENFLFKDDKLAKRVAILLKETRHFTHFINKCVDYALSD